MELLYSVRVKSEEHFEPGILKRMLNLKLVKPIKAFARESFPLTEPLVTIRKGDDLPDFEALAWTAQKRLRAPCEQTVYAATQRAQNIFGGRVPRLNKLQLWHDRQVSEIHRAYGFSLNFRSEDALATKHWLPKIPDAVYLGEPFRLIEFIGDYPASRIEAFCRALRPFNIELW